MQTKYMILVTISLMFLYSCKKETIKPEATIKFELLKGVERKMTQHYYIDSTGKISDLLSLNISFIGTCYLNTIYKYTETKYIEDYNCEGSMSDSSVIDWKFNTDSSKILHLHKNWDYNNTYFIYDTTEYEILELSEDKLNTKVTLKNDTVVIGYEMRYFVTTN